MLGSLADMVQPTLRATILPDLGPDELEAQDRDLLSQSGHLRLLPARDLLSVGLDRLRAWATLRARYQLVTMELVDWLRDRIGGRTALEIGAGMGDLGHHLGIVQSDLGGQRERFEAMGVLSLRQAPTEPPPSVERLDAEAAVAKYQPAVVIGAWVTQRGHDGAEASHGVEEARLVRSVQSYIHVGNTAVHGAKRVLRFKHRDYRPTGLVSRAIEQDKNLIYVWGS